MAVHAHRRLRVLPAGLLSLLALSAPVAMSDARRAPRAPITRVPGTDDHVAVTSWLVAGPLPGPAVAAPRPEGPSRRGYATDFLVPLGGEQAARIGQGTRIALSTGEAREFVLHAWDEPYLDLTDLFGRKAGVCAYLYALLESDREREVFLHCGTNDAGKIWVGGRLVLCHAGDRKAAPSQEVTKIIIPAGCTPVLLKIDQAGGGWGAYVEMYGPSAHTTHALAAFPRAPKIRLAGHAVAPGDTAEVRLVNLPPWTQDVFSVAWSASAMDSTIPLEGTGFAKRFVAPREGARAVTVSVTVTEPRTGAVISGSTLVPIWEGEGDFLAPKKMPDHLVLSLGDHAETDRRVAWRTDAATTGSVVQYVETDRGTASVSWSGSAVATVAGAGEAYESLTMDGDTVACRAHEAPLAGLARGERYAYRVGDGTAEGWSPAYRFEVADASADTLRFIVHGDTRSQMEVFREVIAASAEHDPVFMVNTGDIVSSGAMMDCWDRWFVEAADVVPHYPYMPVIGNHEQADESDNYFHAFALPTNAPEARREQWYSVDYGPTHWVFLNSDYYGWWIFQPREQKEQAAWLERDLASNDKPWVFVSYHHPVYAAHPHRSRGDGSGYLRGLWAPLFDRYHVAAAFQGHDHYYCRTKSIRGRRVVERGAGTVYVTSGGGGAPLYDCVENRWTVHVEKVHHYVLLTVTKSTVKATAYRLDGSVLDEFTLSK